MATTRRRAVQATKNHHHTRASVELDRVMLEDGPVAKALRQRFDRQRLARWRKGERQPDVPGVVDIRKITRGRIPEAAWTVKAPEPKPCKECGRV